MATITEHPEGWLVSVRAQPGARRNGIIGEYAGALKVAVTAPAQNGRANKAIVDTLRASLGVKRSQIEMVTGLSGRDKKLLVRGLSRAELETRIDKLTAN
jgi:uncharacterized protein (TIGR00251 family)